MLSIFPSLLAFEGFAPLIIRIVLGLTLAWFGYEKIKGRGTSSGSNSTIYGVIEIIVSVFLIIGLFTQVAAIINALILIVKLVFKANQKALLTNGINYYILLLAMAISLIFTGPGFISFDLPL